VSPVTDAETCPVHGVEKIEVRSHDHPVLVCPRCRADRQRGETA
jgi:hypothetical protein